MKFKTSIKSWIRLKKVHRVVKFSQKTWLKPYVDMNTELRKKPKNDFEIYFFKLMNKAVFKKTMDDVRKDRDIWLVTTEARRTKLSYNKILI